MPRTIARVDRPIALTLLIAGVLATLALVNPPAASTREQACPPNCSTPIVTPAWHLHMCDTSYEDQLGDNHCMGGDGVTEFPDGTDTVYVIYCHKAEDLVVIRIRDSGGGLQYVNHPDGITYPGNACDTIQFSRRNGIPPGGSPYYTDAHWPEGPFEGVSRGVEWFVGLFVQLDQEDYYGTDAQARITARDPGSSLDPSVYETITVRVTSTSDPVGISMTLREDAPGLALFSGLLPLRFSEDESDEAAGIIKVANRDKVTVTYCPRDCAKPYVDQATWYELVATVTPTPLPTWPGPSPTATSTPPPELEVEYVTLRPAPDDVGYAPQITNRGLPNHLGYPSIYAGMWTRGTNPHYGMVQFDLGDVPQDAAILDARLEMVGRDKDLTEPGQWSVKLLDPSIDQVWRQATFSQVAEARVLAQIGGTLADSDLAEGLTNSFGFSAEQLWLLEQRLEGTQRVSFRVDGPLGADENLFGWQSGVDKYHRDPQPPDPALGPSLHLTYVAGSRSASPTSPSASPTGTASVTPLPTPTTPPASATPDASPTPDGGTTPSTAPTPEPTEWPTPSATSEATLEPTATRPPPTATDAPRVPTATGPAEQRQVCLSAFDDLDGDGARGPSERFLAGVTVKLTHLASGAFVTWTTDGQNDPDYCWSGLTDGHYVMAAVEAPLGYAASGPTTYQLEVPFPGQPAVYAFAWRRPDVPTPTGEGGETPVLDTPAATASPTPSATATATLTPTPSATPTTEPTVGGPSGEICVGVYGDGDRSGDRGPGEVFLGQVPVTVRDANRRQVRSLVTVNLDLVCARLATGVYFVSVDPGPGRYVTSGQEMAVLLTDRQRRILEFGLGQAAAENTIHCPFVVR